VTSGTALLEPGRMGTEEDAPASAATPRAASEATVLAASGRGVRGVSAFVGDGANRWPAVHRLDAARLYRLALEKAVPGARLHGVAEEGVPMRAIAEAIGKGLGVPVRGLAEDEARKHFDWFARFVAIDNPSSSALTRQALGWRPQEPALLTDMRDSGYFS
jgi:nucleoside-diphosphate-sugar epimerase